MSRIFVFFSYLILQHERCATDAFFIANIALITNLTHITNNAYAYKPSFTKKNSFRIFVYTPEPLGKHFCTTREGKTSIIKHTQELASKASLVIQLRYNNFKEHHSNLLRNSLTSKFNLPPDAVESKTTATNHKSETKSNPNDNKAGNSKKNNESKTVVLKTIKNSLFEIAMANAGFIVEKYSISQPNMFLFILDCKIIPQAINQIYKIRNGSKFFRKNLIIANAWFSDVMLSPERVEQLRYLPDMQGMYCKIANSIRSVYSNIHKALNHIPLKLCHTLRLFKDNLQKPVTDS